jgi:hypothetical protein
MYPTLSTSIAGYLDQVGSIEPARLALLDQLAAFVVDRLQSDLPVDLVYICTHNSRRSHFGQFWAAAAANHFQLSGIRTWSGGTEVTAMNPRSVAALERAGFTVHKDVTNGEQNPRYSISIDTDQPIGVGFSKVYDDPSNPSKGFAAIMTCGSADAGCPFVTGSAIRISLPYIDPKAADDTAEEAQVYDLRSGQVAVEQLYLMQQVKELIANTKPSKTA